MVSITDQSKNKEKSITAYRTISEVSDLIQVPQHILRFWEGKFEQISPQKNRGRRYYSPTDIVLLKKIKHLLYEQGFTIKGVKQYFQNNKHDHPDLSSQMNLISDVKTRPEVKINKGARELREKVPIIKEDKVSTKSNNHDQLKVVLKMLYKAREKLQAV